MCSVYTIKVGVCLLRILSSVTGTYIASFTETCWIHTMYCAWLKGTTTKSSVELHDLNMHDSHTCTVTVIFTLYTAADNSQASCGPGNEVVPNYSNILM